MGQVVRRKRVELLAQHDRVGFAARLERNVLD
jgi:hypothetical protein